MVKALLDDAAPFAQWLFPLNRDLWGVPFKRRARVSGVLTYKLDGSVMSIDTRKVIMLPEKMPRLSSLCGILKT